MAQPVSFGLARTIAEIDYGLMTLPPPVREGFANAGFPGSRHARRPSPSARIFSAARVKIDEGHAI
ncbi:hypothetical protein [Shinella sp.]|uniref:hypothetical protein n=1 Tax=Shinella sp. TaxID=1870904 RepID=UPI00301E6035